MTTYVEYIWIDNKGEYRSKCKIIYDFVEGLQDIPEWNFDGSSTDQNISKTNSEVILRPVALFNDPFRKPGKLVLCDCYVYDKSASGTKIVPISTNTRAHAKEIFDKLPKLKPWFGMEQEYFIINPKTGQPFGFHPSKSQGRYYCGVGYNNVHLRMFAEYHMNACIRAGVKISGINAEVAPGQWEFQVGTCLGIRAGDHMHIARYLLYKVAELFRVHISLEPKPLPGSKWNGSGCHTNFSTVHMRKGTKRYRGYHYIQKAVEQLKQNHEQHMQHYGKGNEERMTGMNETARFDEFTWSVGGRNVSVRIGNDTYQKQRGYLEDRRPSSNCDPYVVSSMIFETCCIHNA